MRPLIKILIISDDIEKWASYFKGYHIVTNKEKITICDKGIFICLRSRLVENVRGEKYDKVIVDKLVPDDYLYEIVAPMIAVPKIIYTKDEYRFGKEEN